MPSSILHSLSTFLSRRYNLNSTPSDRDRESLARDVAYSLKHIPTTTTTTASPQSHRQQQQLDTTSVEDGNDPLETTLVELEEALTNCESSLDQFETKERFLYVRIERYREMIRERECVLAGILQQREGGGQEQKIIGSSSDDDYDNDANTSASSDKGEEDEATTMVDAQVPETQDNDVENNDIKNNNNNLTQEQKITQLQIKHQQDQTNLHDVETIHADIIVQIETLKRRILELADKKEDILKKREECREFLVEFAEREF